MARYKALTPVYDKAEFKWRLSIPASISQTGARERRWYASRSLAEAAVKQFQNHQKEFGQSGGGKLLEASRLLEAIEAWQMLDLTFPSHHAPPGEMRKVIQREVKARQDREKSIPLSQLLDSYLAKLKRMNRSEVYLKSYRWLRGYISWILDKKISEITTSDLKISLSTLPDGNFNSNLRLIRAVLNYGVRQNLLKTNPALALESRARPQIEIHPLSNQLVRGMLGDAASTPKRLEMLPYLAIGFFCGCRESELAQLLWSDLFLDDAHLLVRASVSKTRRKRYIPVPECGVQWLRLYLSKVTTTPKPEERILRSFTTSTLQAARKANYKAAGGIGKEPPNSKRRTLASNHIALHQNFNLLSLQLGHTGSAQSMEYTGGVTKQQAAEYFQIVPTVS